MSTAWKLNIAGWVAYLVACPTEIITGNLWLLTLYAAPLSLWAAGIITAAHE